MKNKQQLEVAYPAVFTSETNGGYLIEFPDIQGAFTGINTNDLVKWQKKFGEWSVRTIWKMATNYGLQVLLIRWSMPM